MFDVHEWRRRQFLQVLVAEQRARRSVSCYIRVIPKLLRQPCHVQTSKQRDGKELDVVNHQRAKQRGCYLEAAGVLEFCSERGSARNIYKAINVSSMADEELPDVSDKLVKGLSSASPDFKHHWRNECWSRQP